MGHVLNNTLQDILIRWHRMLGEECCWFPGTDHAGIATESKVDKVLREKEGVDRRTLGREEFIKRVWEWKNQYGGTIIKQLRKLGTSCDWERERFTMDEGLSEAVKQVFVQLYNKGYIYRGKRMVNWCPAAQSALSGVQTAIRNIPAGSTPIVNDLTTGGATMALSAEMGKKLLPLDGSKYMTGALGVNNNYGNVNANANRAQLRFNPIPGDTTQATSIGIYDGRNGLASIARLYAVVNGQEEPYDILHTGNKPSGSYTGNGSGAQRTINTGGIGNMLIIWSTTGKAFVTPGGGLHAIGNTITNFPASGTSSVASFANGVLTLGTTDQTMNTNGQTYHYQVL
jgi:hypothetical protein